MGESHHKIKRHVFELETSRRELAQALQDCTSRIYASRIMPILERVCDSAGDADCIYRIDRVDVSLGVIAAKAFEDDLCERLSVELSRALLERVRACEIRDGAGSESVRVASQLELLNCFARTGALPWWAEGAGDGLEESARSLARGAPEKLAALVRELTREPQALRRLTVTFRDAILGEICELLSPDPAARGLFVLPAALVQLVRSETLNVTVSAHRVRALAWQCVLRAVAELGGGPARSESGRGRIEEALVECAASLAVTYGELASVICAQRALPAVRALLAHEPLGEIIEHRYEQETLRGPRGVATNGSVGAKPLTGPPPGGFPAGSGPTPAESRAEATFSDSDEVYMRDAGLVILWPFLRDLFENLDLTEGDRFKRVEAQHRAVAILYYLVHGEPVPLEHELALPKHLCGLDTRATLELDEPIAEAEAEECAHFLTAVIANASILDDMSIPAFRGTFLLRRGMLALKDGAWVLRVERETYDIALDRLPWGLDCVALPWMEAPLRVEWR